MDDKRKRVEEIKAKCELVPTTFTWVDRDWLLTELKAAWGEIDKWAEVAGQGIHIEKQLREEIEGLILDGEPSNEQTIAMFNSQLTEANATKRLILERAEGTRKELVEAKEEIERLIRIQPDLPTEQAAITELHSEIERLKVAEGEAMLVVESVEYKLTAAKGEIERQGIEIASQLELETLLREKLTAANAKEEK